MSAKEPGRLESWKEIGEYLQRDVRTLGRWEKDEGLPIHRNNHKSRSSVYAYKSEIDAWRAGRKTVPEPVARPLWKIPAFALTMLLCLVMVGNGVRPVAAQSGSQAAKQIWLSAPGDEVDVNRPSADGRYLCFTDWGTGNINVRDLTTGTGRRLTTTGGLFEGGSGDYGYVCVISPDNRQAAYFWFHGKDRKNELRTISLTGGEPRTIPNFSDYAEAQGWTADGKQLLVMRNVEGGTGQLALVSVQDGTVQPLKSFPWTKVRASLSPDGRFVAYHTPADAKTQARDIFVLAMDGSSETAVVQHTADDSFPCWSPDGSRIIFLSDRTGNPSLWSVPVKNGKATGPAELVKAEMGESALLGITRNGALYYSPSVGFRRNVYSANLDANMKVSSPPEIAVQGFLNSNTGPSLSRDGEYLAYYSERPGRLYLVIRTVRSGEEREIPLGRGFEELLIFGAAPQWFPDGRSLLAVSRESDRGGFGFYRTRYRNRENGPAAPIFTDIQRCGRALSRWEKYFSHGAGGAVTGGVSIRRRYPGGDGVEAHWDHRGQAGGFTGWEAACFCRSCSRPRKRGNLGACDANRRRRCARGISYSAGIDLQYSDVVARSALFHPGQGGIRCLRDDHAVANGCGRRPAGTHGTFHAGPSLVAPGEP